MTVLSYARNMNLNKNMGINGGPETVIFFLPLMFYSPLGYLAGIMV